jgi:mannosyltransferase OCH1-like enzyme
VYFYNTQTTIIIRYELADTDKSIARFIYDTEAENKTNGRDFISFIEERKKGLNIPHRLINKETRDVLRHDNCRLQDLIYPTVTKNRSSTYNVPKIVHLTWKTEMIPGMAEHWLRQWEKTNPDWQVWFWTDEYLEKFMNKFKRYIDFDRYDQAISKADVVRYFILYEYGGVYADLDVEPLASLNPLVDAYSCILSQEPDEHAKLLRPHYMNSFDILACNAIMMCRPRHPYFKFILENLQRKFETESDVIEQTGPSMVARIHEEYILKFTKHICKNPNDRVGIVPAEILIPTFDNLIVNELKHTCDGPQSYKLTQQQKSVCQDLDRRLYLNVRFADVSFTEHHWFHTWTPEGKATFFLNGLSFNSTHIHNAVAEAKILS